MNSLRGTDVRASRSEPRSRRGSGDCLSEWPMMPLGFGGQSELAGRALQVQGHVQHGDVPTRDVLGVAVGSGRSRIFVGRSSKPARGLNLRGHHHDSSRRSARSPRWVQVAPCGFRRDPRVGRQVVVDARPFHRSESTTSTHHRPFMIHCLAASICPAGKCLISADTKCDVKCSATSPRAESVTTPILCIRL